LRKNWNVLEQVLLRRTQNNVNRWQKWKNDRLLNRWRKCRF
jgi:hypothetical protein